MIKEGDERWRGKHPSVLDLKPGDKKGPAGVPGTELLIVPPVSGEPAEVRSMLSGACESERCDVLSRRLRVRFGDYPVTARSMREIAGWVREGGLP